MLSLKPGSQRTNRAIERGIKLLNKKMNSIITIDPIIIVIQKSRDTVSRPANKSCLMKELVVPIPQGNPFTLRLLKPVTFFLPKNMVVLLP